MSTRSTDTDSSTFRHHRADVQGLRAIAVAVVVAFHAGLPVPGGFVGVDMFFVISGFVITSMLQRQWHTTRRIKLGQFYLRRFKRLTPALALVVAVTVSASVLLLSPLGPRQTVAQTGLGAMLLVANVVISKASGDYFDAPAAANPLLHTWSLSVEEQFYLVFPLVLLVGWAISARTGRRWVTPTAVAGVGLVSFCFAVLPLERAVGDLRVVAGFYGPFTRAWEFAAGALLVFAMPWLASLSRRSCAALGLLGVVGLAVALLAISEGTPFPGPWTLLPVVATVLLIAAGNPEQSPIARVLGSRPLTAVGDWSYSIYLWHWPFIVFATVLWPADGRAVVLAALLSVLPAMASYYWLETPIRRIDLLDRRRLGALVAVVVVPVLALSAGVLHVTDTVSRHGLEAAYRGEIGWKDHDYRFGGFEDCAGHALRRMVKAAPNYEPRCQQSAPGDDIDLALLGDSHVEHLFIGLKEALPDLNIMYFTANASPSLDDPQYAAAVDYIAGNPAIDTVLVNAFWQVRGVQPDALIPFLQTLRDSGKEVLITDDVPNYAFDPYSCKYRTNGLVSSTCTADATTYNAAHRPLVDQLAAVQQAVPGVEMLHTARYLCDADLCSMTHDGAILYANPDHLNVLGSEYVARRLVTDYRSLLGG